MQPAVRRITGIALCVAAGGGLAWLVIDNALEKGISSTNRGLALVIGLAALTVLWRIEFPKGLSRKEWQKPTGRAQVMNVGLGVFGVLSAAVAMMAPRTAVESEPGAIEATVKATAGRVGEIGAQLGVGKTALIRQKIAGTWGEPGCAVLRRFSLADRALAVETLRVPPGMEPLRWSFTIEAEANEARAAGMRASTFSATEREGLYPGSSVKFRYLTDGMNERLVWDSENQQQAAPELVRCPAS